MCMIGTEVDGENGSAKAEGETPPSYGGGEILMRSIK